MNVQWSVNLERGGERHLWGDDLAGRIRDWRVPDGTPVDSEIEDQLAACRDAAISILQQSYAFGLFKYGNVYYVEAKGVAVPAHHAISSEKPEQITLHLERIA